VQSSQQGLRWQQRSVTVGLCFGSPAVSQSLALLRPVALRPDLTIGLPLSENPFRVPSRDEIELASNSPCRGGNLYRHLKYGVILARVKLKSQKKSAGSAPHYQWRVHPKQSLTGPVKIFSFEGRGG
jgi:hypothetical protein